MKAIFLLMTLPETWEALIISLSNSARLTFCGVRGAILDEEIRRKASGESSSSANIIRGRTARKNVLMERSKSKSKEKKSLALSVTVKVIKSLIVDFINKSMKESRRIRKMHQKRHMMCTRTKEKRGRSQI